MKFNAVQRLREAQEEIADLQAELALLNKRLRVLLPVYWAAKQLLGDCRSDPRIPKKDWNKLVKDVGLAWRVLEKKSNSNKSKKES